MWMATVPRERRGTSTKGAAMSRPAALRVLIAAVACTALAACTSAEAPAVATEPAPTASGAPNPAGGGIAPSTLFTPLVAGTYTTPAPVRGTDGKTHLAYELTLTNALPLPFTLQRVDIRDAATHAVIQSVTGATLGADVTQLIHTSRDADVPPPAVAAPIAPSSTSVVWLDVTLPDGAAGPGRLEHLVAGTIQLPDGTTAPAQFVVST